MRQSLREGWSCSLHQLTTIVRLGRETGGQKKKKKRKEKRFSKEEEELMDDEGGGKEESEGGVGGVGGRVGVSEGETKKQKKKERKSRGRRRKMAGKPSLLFFLTKPSGARTPSKCLSPKAFSATFSETLAKGVERPCKGLPKHV